VSPVDAPATTAEALVDALAGVDGDETARLIVELPYFGGAEMAASADGDGDGPSEEPSAPDRPTPGVEPAIDDANGKGNSKDNDKATAHYEPSNQADRHRDSAEVERASQAYDAALGVASAAPHDRSAVSPESPAGSGHLDDTAGEDVGERSGTSGDAQSIEPTSANPVATGAGGAGLSALVVASGSGVVAGGERRWAGAPVWSVPAADVAVAGVRARNSYGETPTADSNHANSTVPEPASRSTADEQP
jgi:hypothetical protein